MKVRLGDMVQKAPSPHRGATPYIFVWGTWDGGLVLRREHHHDHSVTYIRVTWREFFDSWFVTHVNESGRLVKWGGE